MMVKKGAGDHINTEFNALCQTIHILDQTNDCFHMFSNQTQF